MNSLLVLCFAISEATASALEVLWMRSAGFVLGATALTTATVLACYFTGLGFGAACARRIQRWPVRLYGLLELGTGIGAFWSLAVFHALATDPAQAWPIRLGPIGHAAAVSAALFPATLCIGTTLIGRTVLAEAREALVGLRAEQEQVYQRLEDMERCLREMRGSMEGPR